MKRLVERGPVRAAAIALVLAALLVLAGCGGRGALQEAGGGSAAAPGEPASSSAPSEEPLPPKGEWVSQKIAGMTLEQKVDQLFIIRPETLTGVGTVVEAGDATRRALESHRVGGIVYYQANLKGEEQTIEMLGATQRMAREAGGGIPVFLCVDEEGGSVNRIGDKPGYPIGNVGSMGEVGATGDPENARAVGAKVGKYLSELGFNVNFAPVADVAYNDSSFMAGRSFGADPELVSKMVAAEVEGFEGTGVLCCLKHFPGLGDAAENSDYGISQSARTIDDFKAADLKPFEAGIAAGAPIVMVGHLLTPGATGDGLPASLSREWVAGQLRGTLGFDGVVVTDALEVPAVEMTVPDERIGVAVLQAGADMIVSPFDFEAARGGIIDAVGSGELPESRIDESLARILAAKYDLL